MNNVVHLMDCMEGMAQFPDKYFELAVVDPPYGIGFGAYERVGMGDKVKERYTKKGKKTWDKVLPTQKYFEHLFRVSKNQIIWGSNYFNLPPTQCFIFWYKQNPVPNFADGELAWTSFKRPAACIDYRYYGSLEGSTTLTEPRIHPTQKPIALYKWLLRNYSNPGDKILDTHVGSGSSRIACYDAGLDFTGYEIDADYWQAQEKRFNNHIKQLSLL